MPKHINKGRKKLIILLASILLTVLIAVGACVLYISDYYHADTDAIAAFSTEFEMKEDRRDGYIAFGDAGADTGFVFYPGGKVEYTAYIPLMRAIAREGAFCVLVNMPANLAILDINSADKILAEYSNISNWYIGGHSLGGTAAASYLSTHADKLAGIVLLASYPSSDISGVCRRALSIYGSLDGVLNREKYEKSREYLPQDLTEIVIDGGNHASFGMYGEQQGDGTASLSPREQILLTAEYVTEFIK